MENNELQKIWKEIDKEINPKSKEELTLLLASKSKQTIGKLLKIVITSVVVSTGMTVWLIVSSLNRSNDLFYLINNFLLGLITLTALISGILSLYKLQSYKFNQPLKVWIEEQILSKYRKKRTKNLYLFLLPVIYVLITISFHVYIESKTFIEVLKTDESLISLLIGFPIGLFVSFYAAVKIRKYQINNLEFLKDLHNRLCKLN